MNCWKVVLTANSQVKQVKQVSQVKKKEAVQPPLLFVFSADFLCAFLSQVILPPFHLRFHR